MGPMQAGVEFWARLAVAAALCCSPAASYVGAQGLPAYLLASKKDAAPVHAQLRATLQPSFSVPAEPLGFSAPGEFYLGARNALVSLDFLGENRLLFTFRVPGLIHRDHTGNETGDERKIRAVVLSLPGGTIEAEAVWTLHDKERYIYPLDDAHFLLRDGQNLEVGDATLQLKPFLRFPGPVLWVDMDPARQYLVTGSDEPPAKDDKAADKSVNVGSPSTAAASVRADLNDNPTDPDMVLRILRRDSGKVLLVSHIRSAVHLPINSEGYLEVLRARGQAWALNFNHFDGGSTLVGSVDSVCAPLIDFISSREFIVTACDNQGDPRLVAMSTAGQRLWTNPNIGPSIWPLFITGADGSRLARETLIAPHSVNSIAPLGTDDIKGQDVSVFDAATGKIVLRAAASPIFDAGGNVAISPSGRRVAIVMQGNIQIFDLPPAATLPDTAPNQAKR